jgi:hypothetical protein
MAICRRCFWPIVKLTGSMVKFLIMPFPCPSVPWQTAQLRYSVTASDDDLLR